ncbi:cupin domain-containing protein [uncultured Desulfosarcina sp.]|uniref:cupin domain-containing protein n=1 Tax=uncultured Desulfosarcina sp. TaxID=218289 RepID=UPI0029C9937C|nr:cupin domain-containing protein [uncultured Desulfosarcina sp.]
MTTEPVKLEDTAFHLANFIDYSDDSVVSKTLLKKTTGNLTLFAFDAGQGLSEHTAPFDAVVYILDGQARITIGGQPLSVGEGEMLIMPANISHALHAEKRFKMLLVMIKGE